MGRPSACTSIDPPGRRTQSGLPYDRLELVPDAVCDNVGEQLDFDSSPLGLLGPPLGARTMLSGDETNPLALPGEGFLCATQPVDQPVDRQCGYSVGWKS